MTRKDYILLAQAIKNSVHNCSNQDQELSETQITEIVSTFCFMLRQDNSRFDDSKFTRACGIAE